jgi:hypothetical protein
MNHSIYSADRTTHLKIVVIALVAGIGVAGVGILAHVNTGGEYAQIERVIKAGKPSVQADGSRSHCLPGRALCPT